MNGRWTIADTETGGAAGDASSLDPSQMDRAQPTFIVVLDQPAVYTRYVRLPSNQYTTYQSL
jgi:hypothetical protein